MSRKNIVFIALCMFFLCSCSTIKSLIGEKETLTESQLVAIWYKKQWSLAFYKVSDEVSRKKWKKLVLESVKKKEDEKETLKSKDKSGIKKEEIIFVIKEKDLEKEKDEKYYKYYVEDEEMKNYKIRRLFIEPGQSEDRASITIYIPRRADSRWGIIVSPEIETFAKDPNQPLSQYIVNTIMNNLENISGKAGIKIQW